MRGRQGGEVRGPGARLFGTAGYRLSHTPGKAGRKARSTLPVQHTQPADKASSPLRSKPPPCQSPIEGGVSLPLEWIRIGFPPEELAMVRQVAAGKRTTLAALVRQLVREGPERSAANLAASQVADVVERRLEPVMDLLAATRFDAVVARELAAAAARAALIASGYTPDEARKQIDAVLARSAKIAGQRVQQPFREVLQEVNRGSSGG